MVRKETTMEVDILDENLKPTGEKKKIEVVSLIAEEGKRIKQLSTGITGTRVDMSAEDSEENYTEIEVM